MKNMKLFIWDFDGTLVDSYPYSVSCMQRALQVHGHCASYAEILEQMMENIPVALEYFSEKFQIPELSDLFWEYQQQGVENPVIVFDGVLDVLLVDHVSLAQVPFAIGKYKDGRYKELGKLARHFRTDKLTVVCDAPSPINLDGEIRTGTRVDFSIADEKIQFFYPKGLHWKK